MKELTHYRIKDSFLEPLYKKGDIVKLEKADVVDFGEPVVIQTRIKIYIGMVTPSTKIGFHEITDGMKETHRFISIGRKKFNFYHIRGKI